MAIFTRIKRGSDAHDLAKQLQAESQKNQVEIDQLNDKVGKLSHVCQCLWQIISDQHDLDDEFLLQKMKKLNLEAKKSNKLPPVECSSCKRPIHPSKKKCIFCCAEQPNNNKFFDLL